MNPAPIALFCYNRPAHLARCIEALSQNALASRSELFLFCDGAKPGGDADAVVRTREVARRAKGFAQAHVIESEVNRGLSESIASGASRLCEQFGRTIVVEDDLVVSPSFLDYMNAALDRFEREEAVMQISGFMFPIDFGEPARAFFLPLTTSWGWATWQRAWRHFSNDPARIDLSKLDEETRRRFDLDDIYPYSQMLRDRVAGRNDSWAILWFWTVFQAHGLVLHPSRSLVANAGCDGSGTNYNKGSRHMALLQTELFSGSIRLPDEVQTDALAFEQLKAHLRKPPLKNRLEAEQPMKPVKPKPQRAPDSFFWKMLNPFLERVADKVAARAPAPAKKKKPRVTLDPTAKLHDEAVIRNLLGDPAAITIGAHSHVRGELLTYWNQGRINIGRWCYIGEDSRIWSQASVTIGDYVLISHLVDIHDTDGHPLDWQQRRADTEILLSGGNYPDSPPVASAPVVIEDDAWIGFKATILKGIRIGRGAVVAAGAVVTKDVAPFTVVAGNPAREIRSLRQSPLV